MNTIGKKRVRISQILLAAALLVFSWLLIGCSSSSPGGNNPAPAIRVFYSGPNSRQRGVFEALRIAETDGFVTLVSDPNQAEVFVLNGSIPTGIAPLITNGAGLVLISGPGLTIANRGLPEVEVISNKENSSEIAVTLLRCVGWLSRDDLATRKGHAGPSKETPGAQMPGQWAFDYSIIPFQADRWLDSFRQAYDFSVPLRAMRTVQHPGQMPNRGSFITLEPEEFILSAVKVSEDGSAWLVRGYNISDHPILVSIRPWKPFPSVSLANLAEEVIAPLDVQQDGRAEFQLAAHKIASILFKDNP